MNEKSKTFSITSGIIGRLKPSDTLFITILSILLFIQFFIILGILNKQFLIETPLHTGSISFATTDVPVYYNPNYAQAEVEMDLKNLLHASLLQYNNGTYRTQLASEITRTGTTTFNVELKKDQRFHDGKIIKLEDILFSILMAQEDEDHAYNRYWKDISVKKTGPFELRFDIKSENINFIEGLTIPILPYYVWNKIPLEEKPLYKGSGYLIGAGPYKIKKISYTIDGKPTKITLSSFSKYTLDRPYIDEININIFDSVEKLLEEYTKGNIDSINNISVAELDALKQIQDDSVNVIKADTDRVFALFYNQNNKNILSNTYLRSVLSTSAHEANVTNQVFGKYATPLTSPLAKDTSLISYDTTIESLNEALNDIGWNRDEETNIRTLDKTSFEVSFIYQDFEEIKQIASILQKQWEQLGVNVISKSLPQEEFKTAIQEGSFDIVLVGYTAEKISDLPYILATSTELFKTLNAGTSELDSLLKPLTSIDIPKEYEETVLEEFPEYDIKKEKDLTRIDDIWQSMVYNDIKVELVKNVPGTFLYTPKFLFILSDVVQGITDNKNSLIVRHSSDRFSNVHLWYIRKEKVWSFLHTYLKEFHDKKNNNKQ